MTLTFHVLWMLCGLSAAVFATYVGSVPTHRQAWTAMALGFVLSAAWLRSGRPLEAAWVGGLVAAVAGTQLVRPGPVVIATFAAGIVAALWGSLIHLQGLPQPLAMLGGAALPLTSAYLAQRTSRYAPPMLQEEALVVLLALGVVVAIAPTVSQGWQSALALNFTDQTAPLPLVPPWTVSFVSASAVFGALWSWWRRG